SRWTAEHTTPWWRTTSGTGVGTWPPGSAATPSHGSASPRCGTPGRPRRQIWQPSWPPGGICDRRDGQTDGHTARARPYAELVPYDRRFRGYFFAADFLAGFLAGFLVFFAGPLARFSAISS